MPVALLLSSLFLRLLVRDAITPPPPPVCCRQATSCNFTGNRSPVDGGAILSTGGLAIMDFTDCHFEANSAALTGGAVRADSASRVTARSSVFYKNVATGSDFGSGLGAALYLFGGTPQVEFHECDFRANNASNSGGAVYHDAAGSLAVNTTTMVGNWARYGGAGIVARGDIEQVCKFCWRPPSPIICRCSSTCRTDCTLPLCVQPAISYGHCNEPFCVSKSNIIICASHK